MSKQHNQNNIGGQNQYSSPKSSMDMSSKSPTDFATKSDKIGAQAESKVDAKVDSKVDTKADTSIGATAERSMDKSSDNKMMADKQDKQADKTVGAGVGAAKGDRKQQEQKPDQQEQEEGGLPQIFSQVQGSKEAMKYVRQIEAYAEKNPTQTILATTVIGAFVGWLLTSTKGKAALKNSFSFAQPIVSNWMTENLGTSGQQSQSSSSLKH